MFEQREKAFPCTLSPTYLFIYLLEFEIKWRRFITPQSVKDEGCVHVILAIILREGVREKRKKMEE